MFFFEFRKVSVYMKTMLIGYSACGKSSLAKYIAKLQDTKVLYMDKVHWLPGWIERNHSEEIEIVEDFMNNEPSWVIDGNYHKVLYDRRLQEADEIVFLKLNRITCLKRAIHRYFENCGKSRESMTDGCPEKIDMDFIWWILYEGRSLRKNKEYKRVIKEYADKITVIRTQKDLDRYYSRLRDNWPEQKVS